jgi:prophage maintenance system killer protein
VLEAFSSPFATSGVVGRRKNPGGEYRHQGGEFGISVDLAMECALCAGLNSQDLYGWIWLHLWRDYKKLDNHVVALDAKGKSVGMVFQTASPFDTPRLMTQLVEWISETLARRTLHPLVAIAVFIVLFLQIHPFQDGNGRLSRALTTLLLLRAGYAYVPYSSLESVIEQSKDAYYLALGVAAASRDASKSIGIREFYSTATMVGVTGFEPATLLRPERSASKRVTKT